MRKIIFIIMFLFIFIVQAQAKIKVTTSLFILSDIVKQIGGDRVEVSYMIPPSANPHIFSPTPKSVFEFQNADLFVGVGYGFEFWFDRLAYLRKGKENLFLSDFYKHPIQPKNVDGKIVANPHIWLDLDFIKNVAIDNLTNRLCLMDKKDCHYFRKNEKKFIEKLSKINAQINISKDTCIVDLKPAFEYFLRSMGLKSCCVVLKKGNRIPTVGDLKRVFLNCKCKKGLILYIDNIQFARFLHERLHYKLVRLNPLGDPTNKKLNSYEKLVEWNIKQLKDALHD